MSYCRFTDFLPALSLTSATFVAVAIFTLAPALDVDAAGSAQVAVIFPPWVDVTDGVGRIARAGGRPVRTGRLESIIVAQPDDPHFFEAIDDQGALFVIDPTILGGCLVEGAYGAPA